MRVLLRRHVLDREIARGLPLGGHPPHRDLDPAAAVIASIAKDLSRAIDAESADDGVAVEAGPSVSELKWQRAPQFRAGAARRVVVWRDGHKRRLALDRSRRWSRSRLPC
jgi:hypothetical protein